MTTTPVATDQKMPINCRHSTGHDAARPMTILARHLTHAAVATRSSYHLGMPR